MQEQECANLLEVVLCRAGVVPYLLAVVHVAEAPCL